MNSKRIHCRLRRGLAPLELVLWLPILLFVMALIVNFGTAAAWRVRGEIMARDAVWTDRHHEDANPGLFPAAVTWPASGGSSSKTKDSPIAALSDPSVYGNKEDTVVRGPTLADGAVTVTELFNPDIEGTYRGRSRIEQPFPFLESLGSYDSGQIEHPMLERMWQSSEYGFGAYSVLQKREYEEDGYGQAIGFPNRFRRSSVLYDWVAPNIEWQFDQAVQAARQYENAHPELEVLLGTDRWVEYFRPYAWRRWPLVRPPLPHDFYPRPNMSVQSTDRDVVRKQAVERYLIDYVDRNGSPRLGRITLVPRSLATVYSQYYQFVIDEIDILIDELKALPPSSGISQQIAKAEADQELAEQRKEEVDAFSAMVP